MTLLVVLTVVVIALLIAGLAIYLFWVGVLLGRVATSLEECSAHVRKIDADAALIGPGVEHVNRSAATVAGALPLLYGFAEKIVAKASPNPGRPAVATPASGRRRSRALNGVGVRSSG